MLCQKVSLNRLLKRSDQAYSRNMTYCVTKLTRQELASVQATAVGPLKGTRCLLSNCTSSSSSLATLSRLTSRLRKGRWATRLLLLVLPEASTGSRSPLLDVELCILMSAEQRSSSPIKSLSHSSGVSKNSQSVRYPLKNKFSLPFNQ